MDRRENKTSMNSKVKKSSYSKKASALMSRKYSKSYKAKGPSKKSDYYDKMEHYQPGMRLKPSKTRSRPKPKPRKPKKHVFECGRKPN